MDRREFLKLNAGWMVSFPLVADALAAEALPEPGPFPTRPATEVEGFLRLTPTGRLEVFSGKVDLGTGVRTALSQMVAEELDLPLERIDLVQGDTALTPDQGPTYGSLSIQNGGAQLRQAAATLRGALIVEATKAFSVGEGDLHVEAGKISVSDGRSAHYQAFLGDTPLHLAMDPKAPLKDPKNFKLVGQSIQRPEVGQVVTGSHVFVQDVKLAGMLHARVIHPQAIGAALEAFDDTPCRALPGFIKTVRVGNFLAVVAQTEWEAIQAMQRMVVRWSDWQGLPDPKALWTHVRESEVQTVESLQKDGDAPKALQEALAKRVKRTYDFAIHTHGSMGPSCAVAEWKDGAVTVWTASQQTHLLRRQLAAMLKLSDDHVRCIYVPGSGCYGRNGHEDAAGDAVLLAREMNRPVRVQWMRQDEHGWDPKGPPTLLDYEACVGENGKIQGWHSVAYLPHRPKVVAVPLTTALHADLPREDASPGNVHQCLAVQYGIPHRLCEVRWLKDTPFRPSWIRTPGRMQNTFGNESMMDELAMLAQQDPFAFRRAHLNDPRADDLLQQLMQFAHWTPKVSGTARGTGRYLKGRGMSYVKYELVRTYVGLVVDVTVDTETGNVAVDHCHVAHDCGQIINPDGLRNQIDGNMIQTVSRTLVEELKFDRSRVTSVDWASYPILRHTAVPKISIHLIDRPKEKPWGAGEPSAAVVPSAIANAIYDATGVRMTSVPFTPEKVLQALAGSKQV